MKQVAVNYNQFVGNVLFLYYATIADWGDKVTMTTILYTQVYSLSKSRYRWHIIELENTLSIIEMVRCQIALASIVEWLISEEALQEESVKVFTLLSLLKKIKKNNWFPCRLCRVFQNVFIFSATEQVGIKDNNDVFYWKLPQRISSNAPSIPIYPFTS